MISGAADVLFDELDDDWDAVTFDDLYTPGSYWVNPPSPRTVDGRHADPWTGEVVEYDMSGAVVSSVEAETNRRRRRRRRARDPRGHRGLHVSTPTSRRGGLVYREERRALLWAVAGQRAGPLRQAGGRLAMTVMRPPWRTLSEMSGRRNVPHATFQHRPAVVVVQSCGSEPGAARDLRATQRGADRWRRGSRAGRPWRP